MNQHLHRAEQDSDIAPQPPAIGPQPIGPQAIGPQAIGPTHPVSTSKVLKQHSSIATCCDVLTNFVMDSDIMGLSLPREKYSGAIDIVVISRKLDPNCR